MDFFTEHINIPENIYHTVTAAVLGGSIISFISAYIARRMYIKNCTSPARLDGKIAIVTGANTGCGKWTSIDLAIRGACVIMACRNMKKGEEALKDAKKESGSSDLHLMQLDLSSLESIKKFASDFLKTYPKLHILVNNAGVMMCPYSKTADGFEMQLGTNHLGHFALTNLLLKRIKESAPARIVNLSSRAHYYGTIDFNDLQWEKKPYDSLNAYNQSKLANVFFTKELHRRLKDDKITSYAVHPGWVASDLGRHGFFVILGYKLFYLFQRSVQEGSQTSVYCAVTEGLEKDSGKYFGNCDIKTPNPIVNDEGIGKKLWDVSEQLTGVEFGI